jgi:mannose-6-phosphate isomerase-like protein (cupin superfamily)
MSYPHPRYLDAAGEINATFRPASTPPDFVSTPVTTTSGPTVSNGTAYHYLATSASSEGDFGLYRVDMGPESGGPTTHFHRTMSESFFILSGTLRLFDGKCWVDGTTGDFLYVPPGGLHAFRNESGEPVSMLMLFTPGAPREAYFEGVTELAGSTDEQRSEFFVRHDSYFV